MNQCYRLIWNRIRQCFLVAAEISRGSGKPGSSQRSARNGHRAWLLAWPLALLPLLGLASGSGDVGTQAVTHALVAPDTGPVGGAVTAGSGAIRRNGLTTTIEQRSQHLSLNWQSFNVGAASTVNFAQPHAQSIAVNRIAGSNGSVILGHLNANGQVFLINPNGVLFGLSAQVHVGGLVASTLDIGDNQLGSGTRQFAGNGQASVVNQGSLSANEGGYIALIGPQVTNQGTLRAPGGTVAMGGGSAVTLSFDTNHLLSLQVDQSTLNALADNRQLILADGGQVLMSAGAKNALLSSVVNNSGLIQARTVANRHGRIVLLGGMAAGTTQVAGTLDASAPTSGDGGFIETSAAHVSVADGTKVTALAITGITGTWLIDPQDYTIAATGGDTTGAALSTSLGTVDVSIQSAIGSTAGSGDINVNDAVSWGADTKLTLTASHDININANITATGPSAGLVLTPDASGRVSNDAIITLSGARPSLSIAGTSYTVINSLGAPGSTTGTDLQGVSNNLTANYALGSDIDASATVDWSSGAGFSPLGENSNGKRFSGVFDGLGHTISKLTINRPDTSSVGLFGSTASKAVVHNLGLLGANVTGKDNVGALVGYNYGAIDHLGLLGASVTGNDYVGALLGYNRGAINRVSASGEVNGGNNIGGLAGFNYDARITESYATATVLGDLNVGGLVGQSFGSSSIADSYANGEVGGRASIGGLVGYNARSGKINRAYANGTVDGSSQVGGLVGLNGAQITESYATAKVQGRGAQVGGLVGYNNLPRGITTSYWDKDASGQAASAGGAGVTGLTSAQMRDAASFAGWDVASTGGSTSVWRIYPGQTTPLLRTFMTALTATANNATVTYNGTAFAGGTYTLGVVAPSYWLPSGTVNPALVSGTVNTATRTIDAGTYTSALNAGLYSSQMGYDIKLTPGTLIITPATLGIAGAVAGNKIYDGTTAASISGATLTGTRYGRDAVTLENATAGTFADKNAGTGKTVTMSATLSGTGSSNYQLTQPEITANITAATLAYAATGATTTYGTPATGLNGTVTGFVGGDTTSSATTGTLAWTTSALAISNVGTYGINGGGLTSNNSNYTFTQAAGNATALIIDPAALTISTSDVNKVYDGTTIALGTPIATIGTLFGRDSLSGGTYAFDTKDVGTNKTVSVTAVAVNDGNSGNNYDVTYVPNAHSSITTKSIVLLPIANVSGIAAANKVYDGTTSVTLDFGSAVFNGMATGDSLAVGSAIGVFGDKNAGIGKTVFISGITLGGTDARNYTLLDRTARTTADITPLGILVTARGGTKVYDGTTTAPVALASNGVLAGDSVSFSAGSSYADKNVGSAKPVTVSAIAATGADAGNYRSNARAATTADITPATLTYLATPKSAATGWVPDGLTGVVTGLVVGDTVATATTGTIAWSTPATASSPTGSYAIEGAGLAATNYLFLQAASNATALQLTTGIESATATPQVATIVAYLQQAAPQFTRGNQRQDEADPWTPWCAASRSATSGLPVTCVRIINGGVRVP